MKHHKHIAGLRGSAAIEAAKTNTHFKHCGDRRSHVDGGHLSSAPWGVGIKIFNHIIAYRDFATFNKLTGDGVTWVTRRSHFHAVAEKSTSIECPEGKQIIYDKQVIIGHRTIRHRVHARLVKYLDPETGEIYEYFTNNLKMSGITIVSLYRKRWQIETLFKRMKQNYPLKYFLGDSENAIKIQIWCSLIADLLLKIVKKAVAAKWSFSNLAAMIRLHLMTYIDIFSFLKSPERSLLKLFKPSVKRPPEQLSFVT